MTRSRLLHALSVAAGLVGFAVAAVVAFRDRDAREAVSGLTVGAVAVVFALQILRVSIESHRFRMVLPDRYRATIPVWVWHRVFALGRLLNMVVPQMGTAYRATHLRLGHGLPLTSFFGSILVITWLGNGFAMLISGIIVLTESATAAIVLVATGVASLAVVALLPWLGRVVRTRSGGSSRRIARLAEGFVESFVDLSRRKKLLRVLAVTGVSQVLGVGTYILVSNALDIPRPTVTGSILFAALTIASTVSLTPGGLGISEAVAGLTGELLGVGAGVGVAVALVMRLSGTLTVLTFALVATIIGAGNPPLSAPSDAP